jgi:hypothetical protein
MICAGPRDLHSVSLRASSSASPAATRARPNSPAYTRNQDWLSEFVRSFASSIGMGVKWLGLLGYLDSFQCERSHCVLTRPCA